MNLNQIGATYSVRNIHFELRGLLNREVSFNEGIPLQKINNSLLIAAQEGEGTLFCNNKEHNLQSNMVFILKPEDIVGITASNELGLSLWLISFSTHGASDNLTDILPTIKELNNSEFASLLQSIMEIAMLRDVSSPTEQMDNHNHFQLLMRNIWNETSESVNDIADEHSKAKVSEIIEQLQLRFHEEITVHELAALAGISKRRFTHWFKQLTGKSLTDFITVLRMDHAKHLLLSGECLKDVATKVGYNDEFYFNRRFKQIEGISPGQFRSNRIHPVNICAMSCLGHLLALGVRPAAVAKNLSNEFYLNKLSAEIHKVNNIPLDLQEISYLEPDLILVGNEQEYEKLSPIAPTLVFSQNEHKPFSLLRKLGETLGKGPEAERVIQQYERKTQRLKSRLKGLISSSETFSVMEIRPDSIYVFGNYWCRGAYNLYDGLGLSAPAIVQKEMIDQEAYRLISEEQIPSYAGDHLFLTIVDSDRFDRLSSERWWNELPAVKNDRVYETSYKEFAVTDPISMHHQLDIQMKLMLDRAIKS
ncbi:ABC transporter substrate-binding protein [Paenibacillus sp. GSMTC-2017]|uniref:AraC family transcriptional regulator n=1 Tax=Paenibacillus sp. GSMTC-2017 TaxID=2794350 RepID=UPI0018D9F384|nr:helix-turn-helix domain-containing protein [Paenibacillus sp. GSMTC-2017]MBH5318839.1 ABC transporter substrate-binding protein [Paenibacillus sp. GSMTC-2017]